MAQSIEELYVKKIECGIRGIKLGTKTPEDVQLQASFYKLQQINDGLCDDLYARYDAVMRDYKRRVENKSKKVW